MARWDSRYNLGCVFSFFTFTAADGNAQTKIFLLFPGG